MSKAEAAAKKRTYGLPPKVGSYQLSGAGSRMVVQRRGSHYVVAHVRLLVNKPGDECGTYEHQVATVATRPLPLRKHEAHRVSENEVSYGIPRVKRFGATGHGNVEVLIDGHRIPASFEVSIYHGLPGLKPVLGALNLGDSPEGLDCVVTFSGHPA